MGDEELGPGEARRAFLKKCLAGGFAVPVVVTFGLDGPAGASLVPGRGLRGLLHRLLHGCDPDDPTDPNQDPGDPTDPNQDPGDPTDPNQDPGDPTDPNQV